MLACRGCNPLQLNDSIRDRDCGDFMFFALAVSSYIIYLGYTAYNIQHCIERIHCMNVCAFIAKKGINRYNSVIHYILTVLDTCQLYAANFFSTVRALDLLHRQLQLLL